jgi:hypothetical protein
MHKMIKNTLVGTILVLVMMASAGATEVKVDPSSQTVAAGDAFCVNVIVEDVANMRADQAVLNFDPGVMYVTGVIEGNFLKTGGNTLPIILWNNTAGTATFAYTLTGTWTPVNGSGHIATIEFETYPDAPADTCNLSLTDVVLVDASNETIPTEIFNGAVTIMRGDLNHDNKITSADAVIALQIAVGSRPFDDAADVSGDKQVTALDALMILQAALDAITL